MSNMISGSAIMDTCVLVIASNDKIPQPQTYEHLQAVESIDIDSEVSYALTFELEFVGNTYNEIHQNITDTTFAVLSNSCSYPLEYLFWYVVIVFMFSWSEFICCCILIIN